MARRISIPSRNDIEVFGEWEARDGEVLRIYTSQYQGRTTVQMRTWWQNRDGDWLPGGKGRGMVIPLEVGGVTDELAEALAGAIEAVTAPQPSTNGKADAKLAAENDALKDRLAAMENVLSKLSSRLDDEPAPQPRKRGRPRKTAAK